MKISVFITKILFKTIKDGNRYIVKPYNNRFSKFLLDRYLELFGKIDKKKSYRITDIFNTIKEIDDKFYKNNSDFLLDIRTDINVELQILHTLNLNHFKENKNNNFGFSIHLSFDLNDKKSSQKNERFKKTSYFEKFNKYKISDNNVIYTMDFNRDVKLISEYIEQILIKVYNCKSDSPIALELYGNPEKTFANKV